MMKRILIPVDFTELADHAYNLTQSLFAGDKIELHILSVVTVTPDVLFDTSGELIEDGIIDLKQMQDQKLEFDSSMDEWVRGKKNIVNTKVKIGRLTGDILNYIDENNINLLVMGTSGATGMKEFLMGSHTAYIAMRSPIPVLSVKSDLSDKPFDDVVLAGDFRDPQMLDLSIIKDILKRKKSRLHLLKVNTPGDFEINSAVYNRMQEFCELNEISNARFHLYSDYTVEKGIISFSDQMKADLIAIGTQQRTGLSRVIKRSISYEAINHLKQAVISFPIR